MMRNYFCASVCFHLLVVGLVRAQANRAPSRGQ